MVTSKTLLRRVRDPEDRAAWHEFFAIYAPLLENYARAHGLSAGDAEEVRDQCLEVIARKMPDFEYRAPAPGTRGGFQGWLYRIAKGKIVDLLRKPSTRQVETGELGGLVDPEPGPDELWDRHWRGEHLRYALAEVKRRESPASYGAFELLLVEELSVPEVCARLNLNANQVYKAKSRVLRRVRETLGRLGTGATLAPDA